MVDRGVGRVQENHKGLGGSYHSWAWRGKERQVYQENCVEKTILKGLGPSTNQHNQPIERHTLNQLKTHKKGCLPWAHPTHNERAREITDAIPKSQPACSREGRRIRKSDSEGTKERCPAQHLSFHSVPVAGRTDGGLELRKHTVSSGIVHGTETAHSARKLNGTNMPLAVWSEDRGSFSERTKRSLILELASPTQLVGAKYTISIHNCSVDVNPNPHFPSCFHYSTWHRKLAG